MSAIADALLAAVDDGRRLVSWAAPNAMVLNEAPVEAKLLGALASPGPNATPMLRFCDPDVPPIPLLDGMLFPKRTTTRYCERVSWHKGGKHRLLVPMGASVVAFHVCGFCRDVLNDIFNCHLVWD